MDTITIDGIKHRLWLSTDRDNARKLSGYCHCCDWTINNATNWSARESFKAHHAAGWRFFSRI
jgi:hypothetical protein